MADVALVSIEPANSALSGTKVMARALDALARANVEVLAITSSSYRQNFCFLVRQTELERVIGVSGREPVARIGARLFEADRGG